MSSGRDSRRGSKAEVLQQSSGRPTTPGRESRRGSKADALHSSSGRDSRRGSTADALGVGSAPSSPRETRSRRGSRNDVLQSVDETGQGSGERREKAKSSQSYTQYSSSARRSSLRPEESSGGGGAAHGSRQGSRANSLPLGERTKGLGSALDIPERDESHEDNGTDGHGDAAQAQPAAGGGQDEDEVAGVTGTVKQYQPFRSPEVGASNSSIAGITAFRRHLLIIIAARRACARDQHCNHRR